MQQEGRENKAHAHHAGGAYRVEGYSRSGRLTDGVHIALPHMRAYCDADAYAHARDAHKQHVHDGAAHAYRHQSGRTQILTGKIHIHRVIERLKQVGKQKRQGKLQNVLIYAPRSQIVLQRHEKPPDRPDTGRKLIVRPGVCGVNRASGRSMGVYSRTRLVQDSS